MWDLWCTKWHWGMFFSEHFGFPLLIIIPPVRHSRIIKDRSTRHSVWLHCCNYSTSSWNVIYQRQTPSSCHKHCVIDAHTVQKLRSVFPLLLGLHIALFPVIGCKVTVRSRSSGRHDLQRGTSSRQNSKFYYHLLCIGHGGVGCVVQGGVELHSFTKLHGRMSCAPISYSGGPGFKFWNPIIDWMRNEERKTTGKNYIVHRTSSFDQTL